MDNLRDEVKRYYDIIVVSFWYFASLKMLKAYHGKSNIGYFVTLQKVTQATIATIKKELQHIQTIKKLLRAMIYGNTRLFIW